jgi:hypothetical protein
MEDLYKRSFAGTPQPFSVILGVFGCVVLAFFQLSCSPESFSNREKPEGLENRFDSRYSMLFVIHGDGDYLFHDSNGRSYKADNQALAGAMKVAVQNIYSEVFIFHQRSRRHFLYFIPRPDGKVYYYRNGRLIDEESYWRDGPSRFDSEIKLYERLRTRKKPESLRMFLYFGHQIPEFDGSGYDASFPHRTFTVDDLADGLQKFTRDSAKFDLIVLSTCFNGTPHTISAISPYTRIIVASPENLHLSYFDLQPFERIEIGLPDENTGEFFIKFARHAFDRLTKELQTTVTVAVYDVDRVRKYIHAIDTLYDYSLTRLIEQKPGSVEHYDCAEDTAFARPGMSEGVDVFYRPPRFGRFKQKQSHSGWECLRLLK